MDAEVVYAEPLTEGASTPVPSAGNDRIRRRLSTRDLRSAAVVGFVGATGVAAAAPTAAQAYLHRRELCVAYKKANQGCTGPWFGSPPHVWLYGRAAALHNDGGSYDGYACEWVSVKADGAIRHWTGSRYPECAQTAGAWISTYPPVSTGSQISLRYHCWLSGNRDARSHLMSCWSHYSSW